MLTDQQALASFATDRDAGAFAALVNRHLDLVYSVARRITRDSHLAQDVTQAVFIVLARRAKSIDPKHLAGWLASTARLASLDSMRIRKRRQRRETEAAAMRSEVQQAEDATALQMTPLLDAALAGLSDADRSAVVLRFLQGRTFPELGETLGVTEEAARKRVERALEKLRGRLMRDGVSLSVGALVVVLASHQASAAPVGLAGTILSSGSTASAAAIAKGVDLTMWLAKAKWIPAITILAFTVTGGALTIALAGDHPSTAPTAGNPQRKTLTTAPVDITGTVSDPDGNPVSNATVTLFPFDSAGGVPAPDDMRYTSHTDAQGIYHLPLARRNRATSLAAIAIVQADGFGAAGSNIIDLSSPATADLTLNPATDVKLICRQPDSKPASNLEVYLAAAYWFDHAAPQPVARAPFAPDGRDKRLFNSVTDAAGKCVFKGLPRGATLQFGIRDQRYAQLDDTQYIKPPADESSFETTIHLTSGASISGRVTCAPTGKPLAGAAVQAITTPQGHRQVVPVFTGADGTYSIKQLRGGQFTVELLAHEGMSRTDFFKEWTWCAVQNVKAPPGSDVKGCDLKLIRGSLILGNVVDQDDKPAPGISVFSLSDPSHGNDTGQMVASDDQGHFTLRLPPGKATIVLNAHQPAGWKALGNGRQDIIVEDKNDPIEFRVERSGALR